MTTGLKMVLTFVPSSEHIACSALWINMFKSFGYIVTSTITLQYILVCKLQNSFYNVINYTTNFEKFMTKQAWN